MIIHINRYFQVTVILILSCVSFCTPCDVQVNGCGCIDQRGRTFALRCPTLLKNRFTVFARVNEAVKIMCQPRTNVTGSEIVDVLKQLKLFDKRSENESKKKKIQFIFERCSLPDMSYQQLLDDIEVFSVSRVVISGHARLSVDRNLLENISATNIEIRNFPSLVLDETFFNKQAIIKKVVFASIKNLTINTGTFDSLPNLLTLELASCGLKSLDKDIFKNLTKLEDLNLHGNLLTELPKGVFDSLSNLTKIVLSRNHLKSLPSGLFDHNPQLNQVSLSFNCFESLPTKLFAGKMKLEHFDYRVNNKCSDKRLALPEYMFENSSVKEIKILGADVSILPEKFLFGCSNLVKITIQSSKIKHINRAHFSWSPNLEKVDFINNEISDINMDTFEDLKHLKILRLSYNRLDKFDENILDKLTKLEILHLKNNNIEDISDQIFQRLSNLKHLDLSNNRINRFPTPEVSFLEILELGNNDISTFGVNMLKPFYKLKSLGLQGNSIVENLDLRNVEDRSNYTNTSVDLSNNRIKRVFLPEKETKDTKLKINVTGNALLCDCFATEFKKIFEDRQFSYSSSIENTLIKGHINDFHCGEGLNLQNVSFEDLVCQIPSNLFDMKCPNKCSCSVNKYYRSVNVNCNDQGFAEIPEDLPLALGVFENIVVNMRNNNIQNLTKSMEKLEKKNATIFNSIRKLYLTNNNIKSVGPNFPHQLNTLHLDINQLQYLSNETIQILKKKAENLNFSLKLSSNPFSCDCSSAEVVRFVKLHYSHVDDYRNVSMMCIDGEKKLFHQSEEDFCPETLLFTIVTPAIIIGVLFCILLIINICYKETIMIYIFSKPWGKIFFSEDTIDKEKPYDAFLSYSHHDATFVEQTLLPGLESEENPKDLQYKCLIHTRDWNVGEMIPDQILESVEKSRRTLIVLSSDYVKSTWSKMEFQEAHNKAMKEQTQRVIIIVHGEMPDMNEIDEDVQKYLKSNTFIKSDDPWFWKKLRYALPKKRCKQKVTSKRKETQKPVIKNDKKTSQKIHESTESVNKNRVTLPYCKQFSRETLLPSESLRSDLEQRIEQIC